MLSVFDNQPKLLRYIAMWMLYAVMHLCSLSMFAQFQFVVLLADALIYALLYASSGILLMYIVKYAGLDKMNNFQRNLNCFVLFVIAIVVVVSINFFSLQLIFGNEIDEILIKLIPLRIFISAIIYSLIVTSYRLQLTEHHSVEEENIETEEIPPLEKPAENVTSIDRIAVKTGQKIHVIPVDEIFCLQADSDYVHIFTEKGKYLKEQTMKYFDENLPSAKFVRVHRSYIVNVEAISRVELYEKQTQLLTLKNGMQLRMSQSGYRLLKEKLKL